MEEKREEEEKFISFKNGGDECHDNTNSSPIDICNNIMNENMINKEIEMFDTSQPSMLLENENMIVDNCNQEVNCNEDITVNKSTSRC